MGKGASRTVYDFLMSIDFGFCHGPVDAFNQIWIKDKPIWCGKIYSRTDVPIDLVNLFGGDDAEGGVKGTVEVYTGETDQVSSEDLANRVGLTPTTMPGYRGIAHLFFRGASSLGWRWATNNPYLSATKASITSMPALLGQGNKEIFPHGAGERGGFIRGPNNTLYELKIATPDEEIDYVVGTIATNSENVSQQYFPRLTVHDRVITEEIEPTEGHINTTEAADSIIEKDFDLVALGLDPDLIDSGEYTFDFNIGATALVGGGAVRVTVQTLADDGSGEADYGYNTAGPWDPSNEEDFGGISILGPISTDLEVSGTFPSGTRFLRVKLIDSADGVDWHVGRAEDHCGVSNDNLRLLPNANPAHVIYECMVDTDWGKGESPSLMDDASFKLAGAVFQYEKFGLSLLWNQQTEIEDFIQEVLDHVQAVLYQDPTTGLWNLKALRADENTAGIRALDPSNCTTSNRTRRTWGETINEVVVSYTDPATEKDATVAAHDLANISIQGGIVSESRNYYGVRDPVLAQYIAERDVSESAYPLFTCKAVTHRSFADVRPGDLLRLDWPEDGISNMLVRVMDADYGTTKDRRVALSLTEDIFSLERTQYQAPQTSLWANDRVAPTPLDYEIAMTTPLPFMLQNGFSLDEVDAEYPAVRVMLLGDQGTPRPADIHVFGEVQNLNGGTATGKVTSTPITRTEALGKILPEEVSSTIPGDLVTQLYRGEAVEGDLLLLGDEEDGSEIIMLSSYSAVGDEWTVKRGIWDTVPRAWPDDARIWQFPGSAVRADPNERVSGDALDYYFLPRTTQGVLDISDATAVTITPTDRPHAPFRPAGCQLDDNGFATTEYIYPTPLPSTITATWANRDRATEDQVALAWDDSTVTPESGQTTVLRILDENGDEHDEITGLSGTSHEIPIATFGGLENGWVEFLAERDGIRSWDGARRAFDLTQYGYGAGYGESYGP